MIEKLRWWEKSSRRLQARRSLRKSIRSEKSHRRSRKSLPSFRSQTAANNPLNRRNPHGLEASRADTSQRATTTTPSDRSASLAKKLHELDKARVESQIHTHRVIEILREKIDESSIEQEKESQLGLGFRRFEIGGERGKGRAWGGETLQIIRFSGFEW